MPSAANTRKPALDTPLLLSGRWQVDPQASHARFVAGTLAGLIATPGRFRSVSGDLDADEAHAAGVLVIDASSIDTGNQLRDRHLRSRGFFDVKRHPQIRYELHSVSSQGRGTARLDGELSVAGACTPLPLDATLQALTDGLIEVACHTEVDRIALGIRGARGMVPRTVQLDIAIVLRQASA
jgi:polyisoprenoid-binding protein YceI